MISINLLISIYDCSFILRRYYIKITILSKDGDGDIDCDDNDRKNFKVGPGDPDDQIVMETVSPCED